MGRQQKPNVPATICILMMFGFAAYASQFSGSDSPPVQEGKLKFDSVEECLRTYQQGDTVTEAQLKVWQRNCNDRSRYNR